jgi:predicted dehydrogenase
VRSGKDVYCEKPLSHSIEEGQTMIKAVRATDRIVQVGMQQRSTPHFLDAREIVRAGRLGDVHFVTTYWYQDFTPNQTRKWPDPMTVDWKRFLGGAPWRSLEKEPWRYWDWRYFWDYSGGALCDNGVHICDWIHMLMGDRDSPVSAACTGGTYKIKRWDTPDVFSAAFEYENGWVSNLNFNYTQNYRLGHFHGSRFGGTAGMLDISRRGWKFYPSGAREPTEVGEARGLTEHHMKNFFDCVRSRQEPNAPIEIGHRAVRVAHLGNIAYRDRRRVHFDPVTERVTRA